MKQGEIWDLYLDPVSGSEQGGRRPAVILSGNLLNQFLKVVVVCPLTTSIKNYKGNLILTPNKTNGLQKKSEVLTFHIRSVSKSRLDKRLGTVSEKDIAYIKRTLDDILRS